MVIGGWFFFGEVVDVGGVGGNGDGEVIVVGGVILEDVGVKEPCS